MKSVQRELNFVAIGAEINKPRSGLLTSYINMATITSKNLLIRTEKKITLSLKLILEYRTAKSTAVKTGKTWQSIL